MENLSYKFDKIIIAFLSEIGSYIYMATALVSYVLMHGVINSIIIESIESANALR